MSPVAHPVGAGVPDGPYRRTLEYRRTLVYPSVGAGVPDGPHRRTLEYRRTFVYPSVGVGFYPARRLYFAFAFMPPVAIFLSTAKEIWKRTPPKTDGFWISLSSNCNCGAKRFRTESPARLSPLPAPASRTKTFFSRAVQRKCFTSYIILYSAARRAAPIYHSPPENATRSRVPRLTAPNGHTPPTRISPCLRSRTP